MSVHGYLSTCGPAMGQRELSQQSWDRLQQIPGTLHRNYQEWMDVSLICSLKLQNRNVSDTFYFTLV